MDRSAGIEWLDRHLIGKEIAIEMLADWLYELFLSEYHIALGIDSIEAKISNEVSLAVRKRTYLTLELTQFIDIAGSLRLQKSGGITPPDLYQSIVQIYGQSRLDRKAIAATAAALGLGIFDDKTLTVEAGLKIEHGAFEVDGTFGIDKDLDAVGFYGMVFVLGIVKRHAIGHAGASTAPDLHAQTLLGLFFLLEQAFDLGSSRLGDGYNGGFAGCGCVCHDRYTSWSNKKL